MGEKLKVKYYLDLVMLLTLSVTALTGLANLYLGLSKAKSLMGIGWPFFVYTHAVFAITTVILILVHLLLHLEWIKFSSKKIFGGEKIEK